MTDKFAIAPFTPSTEPQGPSVTPVEPPKPVDDPFAISNVVPYSTPSPVPTQPEAAPKQLGPTIAAARELPHPLTKEVERNLALMDGTPPTNDEENEAVAKLLVQRMGMQPDIDPETGEELKGPPAAAVNLARNMHPEQRRLMLERQDIQHSLKQARQTRLRMAVDAEAAAVLKGVIKPMAASEKAIESLGLQIVPPYADYLRSLPRERVTFGEGAANGTVRGLVRIQMNYFMENAEELLIAAQDADKPILDVISDAFTNEQFGVDIGAGNLAFNVIPRLFERLVSDETSKEKAAQAAEFLKKAMARYKMMGDLQFSDAAQPFMQQMNAISKEGGKLGQVGAFIRALRDNPLSATAFFTEVMAEQAPTIGAALATKRLPAGAVLAPSVSVASAYIQERYTPAVEQLKKEFGIDLTTTEGQQKFINNPEALRRQIDFSSARAMPIAVFAGLSMWTASKSLASSATGNVIAQTPVQAFLGGAGEAGAGLLSLGEIDVVETLVEALAEAHPGQVMADIAIAGQQDVSEARRKKRAEEWLRGNTEVAGHINGIPTESLRTASEVLAEKWKGQGVERVLLSASELMRFDQDDDTDIVATLGLDPEEVKQAAKDGQDVTIDTATFVRHILGKDGFSELLRHTRTDAEEFTPAEAEQFDALEEDVLAKINQEAMDRITRSLGVEEKYLDDFLEDANAIRVEMEQQLQNVGQYSAREIGLFAQLTAQRYMARAIRATKAEGTPVRALDLFLEDGLRVEQGQIVEGAFEQRQRFADDPNEIVAEAARRRVAGEITQEEYDAVVERERPATVYSDEDVRGLRPATEAEMRAALKAGQQERVGKGGQFIGQAVGLRLDIPAYTNHDTWVPTMHDPKGKPIAHEAAAKITEVEFTKPGDPAERKAAKVGTGQTPKAPFAQINGTLQSVDPVALKDEMVAALEDPAWTQVGYDPRRHTFFYERGTRRPVLSADEVIQVGPLVMAKNVTYGDAETFLFQDDFPTTSTTEKAASLEVSFNEAGKTTFPNNRSLKVTLQERVLDAAVQDGIDLSEQTPEVQAHLTRVAVQDALYALKDNANAVGWYDEKVSQALEYVSLIHPELKTDESAKLRFIWGLAVTSNGLKVDKNFQLAEQVYQRSKNTGKFPTDIEAGQAQAAINEGLALYNELIDRWGYADLRRFMTSEFTRGQIEKTSGVKLTGENIDTVLRGSAVLGPKIGNGFFSNLYGYFDALTMDRWLMRTWGRWTGTLIESRPDMVAAKTEELTPLLAAFLADDTTRAAVEGLAGVTVPSEVTAENVADIAGLLGRRIFISKQKRDAFNLIRFTEGNTVVLGDDIRKLANALTKYLDGQVEQPRDGNQRNFIRAVFADALRDLQENHGLQTLTMSDLQALLWYPEKRLYDAAKSKDDADSGYDDDEAPDYANAAAKLAKQKGAKDADIKRIKSARRGASGSGSSAAQQGAGGQFSASQRKRFLARQAITRLRSARSSDAASPRPYRREGGGNRKGFRVLGKPSLYRYKIAARKTVNDLNAGGIQTPPLFEVDGAEFAADFHSRIQQSKKASPFGASVYVYKEHEYAEMRLFMSEDGEAGFALKGDDIVSVFSTGKYDGVVHSMMELAIQAGGRRLDAFDTVLPELYSMHGFRIGGRLAWDEGEAPPDWDKSVFSAFNNGEPDVVFMGLDVDNYDKPADAPGTLFTDYGDALNAQQAAINVPEETTPAFEQGSEGKAPPRGGFTPSDLIPDQDGNPVNLIQIFEKGDTSTFLHESGHFWLEQLKSDAARFGDSFEKDWRTVTKWWQSRSEQVKEEAIRRARKDGDKAAVAALQKMTAAQVRTYIGQGELRGTGATRYLSVAMHEQFARGVEKYFETGEAPSMALLDAFIAFSNFIKSVYRRIRGQRLDVEFSPEVKGVLDRMLASDAEIELAASQYELTALFETAEEAGVSPEKFQEMQAATARAKDRAKGKQLSKHIRDKQRERLEWYQDEAEKLRPDIESTVSQQREYRILYALTQGGEADGSTLPSELLLNRIDRKALVEMMPEGRIVEELPRVDNRAIYEVATKDGNVTSPAVAAGMFGFTSPEEMIDALLELPSFDSAVNSSIEAEMKARHGDMDVDAIGEATASIHSDPVTGVLMSELQALRTTEPAFDAKFLRYYAQKRLAEMPVGQSQPYKFLAAEKRHAKLAGKALKKGDRATAYQHQFQRLVNHELAKQAIRFQEEHRKITKYLRTFQLKRKKWKGIDADYVDNIKNIVNRLDFGSKTSERARLNAELQALNDFIENEQKEGAIIELPQWLREKDAKKNFRDMTVGELREVNDAVKMLEQQGRNKKRAIFGKEQREMRQVVADMRRPLVGESDAITTRLRRAGGKAHALHGAAATVSKVDSVLLKIEQLMEAIDGQPLGAWHQALYQPFADAYAQKQDMMKEVTDAINKRMSALPRKVRKNMGKRVDVGDLGTEKTVFTRSMLIMLALNTGNQSNLDKLIKGYADPDGPNWNINEELIDKALEQLTKEEWELVQEIWDLAEKMWPQVDAIYRAENGRSPDRIEPRPIETPHGTFKGGYFPMMYDASIPGGDGKRSMLEQMTALEMMQSQVGRASVNSSMTKERSDTFYAPVSLEIHKLPHGFQTTMHFITHYKAVQQAKRLMSNKELRGDLERKVGIEYAKMIDNWIAAMAGDNTHLDIADGIVAALGRNTTVAILGLSYTTMMAQTLGLLTTFDRLTADNTYTPGQALVTTGDIAHGIAKVFDPAHRKEVYRLSGEMRHRMQNVDRELRNGMRALEGKKGVRAKAQMMAMMSVAGMQLNTVDFPTWTAAYNRMMRDSGQDVDKSVAYADRVLRLSQSGGGEKDLSAIQRKRGLWKSVTMFYSFFSVLYGILRQVGGEVVEKPNPMTVLRAASRIFVVLTLQELGMALIRGELPDWEPEDEDDESMLAYLGRQTLLSATATVPLARDLIQGAVSDYGYSPTPLSAFGENLIKTFEVMADWMDEEVEWEDSDRVKVLKPIVMSLGIIVGIPAVQPTRFLDGWAAQLDEENNWSYFDLLMGYDEDRAKLRD